MASDQVAAPTAEPEKVEKEKTEAKKSGGDAADKEEQDQVGKSAVPNEHEDKPLTARIPSPVIGPLPPPDFVLPSEPESREEQRKSEGDSVMSAEDREELSLVCEHCLETARMIQQVACHSQSHSPAPAPPLAESEEGGSVPPTSEDSAPPPLLLASPPFQFKKEHIDTIFDYLASWIQRQCTCIFRIPRLVDHFALLTQELIKFTVQTLKSLPLRSSSTDDENKSDEKEEEKKSSTPAAEKESGEPQLDLEQTERLLLIVAKLFMLHFPLYQGPKQVGHRFEEVSAAEGTQLAVFCETQEHNDYPISLLRNVTLFCKSGGLQGMATAFKLSSREVPPSMAHSLILILSNIKHWTNYRAVCQLFGPVRSNALGYMCQMSDDQLRTQAARNMADFLWTSVKDVGNLGGHGIGSHHHLMDGPAGAMAGVGGGVGGSSASSSGCFDKDGLELALKFFLSSTLTMRLTGINQINQQINAFNEMCNTESVVEVEKVGLQLAGWILNNRVVEHTFGPSLHVEVIKQSHILLNFLAVEGKISEDHTNAIWQAAQLKHCSKQVHDLLLPLIKNLEAGPVLHIYKLAKELPVKDHTEQTIHLCQVLQKFIWSNNSSLSSILQEASALQQQHQQQQQHHHHHHHHQMQQQAKAYGDPRHHHLTPTTSSEEEDEDEEEEEEEEEEDEDEQELLRAQQHIRAPGAVSAPSPPTSKGVPAGASSRNKNLLDGKNVLAAASAANTNPDFSMDEDLDDDIHDYSEYEDEDEEEEEDDDDDDLPSSDESAHAAAQSAADSRVAAVAAAAARNRDSFPGRGSSDAASSSSPPPPRATSSSPSLKTTSNISPKLTSANPNADSRPKKVVPSESHPSKTSITSSPSSPPKSSLPPSSKTAAASEDDEQRMSPGKRTKGLPVKGIKRRLPADEEDGCGKTSSSAESSAAKSRVTPSKLPEKKASDGSDPEDVDDEEESMREVEASVTLPTGGVGSPANFLNTENNKKQRVGNEGGASSGVSVSVPLQGSNNSHITPTPGPSSGLGVSPGGMDSSKCWWPSPVSGMGPSAGASHLVGQSWRPPIHPVDQPGTSGQSRAMTELANLVNAHPRSAGPLRLQAPEVLDMRPVIQRMGDAAANIHDDGGLSGDNESLSSRVSDKNLADFEDENNSVDEEMLQLAQRNHILHQQQQLANMALYHQRLTAPRLTARQQREEARLLDHYKVDAACDPGNTLLWDLLQDGNIEQLAEGLAMEAEKALSSLLCISMERFIRLKFIEGCLSNIAQNKSVAMSLRLIPKLIQSFTHFRGGMDVQDVVMYVEKTHNMMQLFFDNLKKYTADHKAGKEYPFFNHLSQIQIRLHFLSIIYSAPNSPPTFQLEVGHVNTLWECMATDPVAQDDLFSWLIMQLHSKDQHALDVDGFRLIYSQKLSTLQPESITMLGLNLFSQLCQKSKLLCGGESGIAKMDHLWKHSSASDFDFSSFQLTDSNVTKMDQLWRIALCAQNTDVSMKAIQILNTVYFSKGEEFLTTCMRSLEIAAQDLKSGKDEILLRIQRALLLLKTYLETFRKKYAYNFRRMSIDGHGVSTHAELLDLRSVGPIRVVVQAAGFQEKVTLEMQASDLIADLRAEISAWWEGRISAERNAMAAAAREGGGGSGGNLHHAQLLGTILGDGPLRLISQGQEISADFDEKNLMDYGFKDLQMVFVSQGASRQQQGVHGAKMASNNMDVPAFPGKDKMPMNILLKPEHFEQLFSLMLRLSELRSPPDKNGYSLPLQKAQIFSRRVWDILMLLPTNPQVKTVFENIGRGTTEEDLKKHMSPDSPQKLMYTFYIVDWLGRPSRVRRHSGAGGGGTAAPSSSSDPQEQDLPWIQKFIKVGGLKHLFDILISGRLQRREDSAVWCEWRQDCLGALLKLLVQFGVDTADYEALADQMLEASSTPRKRLKRYHANRNVSGGGMGSDASGENRMLVPRLSNHLLEMMNVDTVMPKITSVFIDASYTKDLAQYRTGVFGRAQVVHFAMNLLLAWLYSVNNIEDAFFTTNGLPAWLRSLLLEDPDPAVRREMCSALYKMCLGSTTDGRTGSSCTAPLLSILLEFLDDALAMTPARRESVHASIDDSKELYGPACRDYFWILSRLVDNLHTRPGCDPVDSGGLIDLDMLARQLACGLVARPLYEKRQANPISDDCLVGSLNLLSCVMKHEPAFKSSQEGMDFLLHLLECLFALPSPKEKDLPKCKSAHARSSCYDLLIEMCKGSSANYTLLHNKLLEQHKPESHKQYPWEYWPRDDGRSECGYVGLTNLGATCYLASCVQQLYMIPQARACILKSKVLKESKHTATLEELQRMFAYLRESERKAYNPLSFCKTYHMDHKPLNTGEQKDMAEFFIDLLSKMEDMSPDLKTNVKKLFGGTLTNNVVSLDCEHVSRTVEEFYTVRCTVQELRSLTQSLEEVTVKDTLEGDNMYTCSSCGKKVRAEKRACFKKLPKIIAFNTMRYTFNMVTMLKEKVNTHFSFPFKLDMSGYMEENLIPEGKKDVKKDVEEKKEAEDGKSPSASSKNEEEKKKKEEEEEESPEDKDPSYEYELIGVTVHTGTAEGGHYYAFIRDRTTLQRDKWYSFNDAEVKPFDPSQIASECFGGEVASKTYDQVHDKFMELSIEKTNSAYMLFYERVEKGNQGRNSLTAGPSCVVKAEEENNSGLSSSKEGATATSSCLTQELDEWIWKDNMTYIKDINVFDHTYFNFMWQMVSFIPASLNERATTPGDQDITLMGAKLSTTFFLESFIHAKEKLNIVQWVELLTKQFDSSHAACSWFLDYMATDMNWPITIFLKCQVGTIRQMYHRLCIHVIQKLRPQHKDHYLIPWTNKDPDAHPSDEVRAKIGSTLPITRFVRMLLSLLESGQAKPHLKYLPELFRFLHDFAKLGEEETRFLLKVNAISTLVEFYLKIIKQSNDSGNVDLVSDDDDDEDDDIIPLTPPNMHGGNPSSSSADNSNRMSSLDKMIFLIALLVEKSRGEDNLIHLSKQDWNSLVGTAGAKCNLVFLHNVTKDNINICQTSNLIFSLTRNNPGLAEMIANMLFQGVKQESCSVYFYHLLTRLTEFSGGPSGMPCYTNLVMHKIWDIAKITPQAALDWLSMQVARNRHVQTRLLSTLPDWVEPHLLAHGNAKVRNAAAILLINLVPSTSFRANFRATRNLPSPLKDLMLSREDQEPLTQILEFLFSLLPEATKYTELTQHGSSKLVAYFQTLSHCLLTRDQKLLFAPHFMNLWNLFHPKLSEPAIPVHHNKQALLTLWWALCHDCPENIALILKDENVMKNIAFNYILADHEDGEVVQFNRSMLPAYYGLLRMCCQQSRAFTRQLACHQNIQWAFKNITPFTTQYTLACDELFKLMSLFVQKFPDASEDDEAEIRNFRHQTLQLYLSILDGRSSWSTLIQVLKILAQSNEDRIFVVYNNGLSLIFDAFNMLHMMFHEATACHVTPDIIDLLSIFTDLLKAVRVQRNNSDIAQVLSRWKDMGEMTSRILTLCNTYTPNDMRENCFAAIKEMVMLWPNEMLTILVPILHRTHQSASEAMGDHGIGLGPFSPRVQNSHGNLGPLTPNKTTSRPPRPMIQMSVTPATVEVSHGSNPEFDKGLQRYFHPYHTMVDFMVRIAVNEDLMSKNLVELSALVGLDGVPLHFQLFPKLWLDIYNTDKIDRKFVLMLLSSHGFIEYIDAVLLDERSSLNNFYIFNFLKTFFPKICDQVLTDQVQNIITQLVHDFVERSTNFHLTRASQIRMLNGDLRALLLVNTAKPEHLSETLLRALLTLKVRIQETMEEIARVERANAAAQVPAESSLASDSETAGATKDAAASSPTRKKAEATEDPTKKQTSEEQSSSSSKSKPIILEQQQQSVALGNSSSGLGKHPAQVDPKDKEGDSESERGSNRSPLAKRSRKMSSGLLTTSDVHSAGSSGSSTSAATAAAAKHKSAKGEERNKFKEECTTFLMTLNLLVNLCKLHLKKNSDDDEEGVKPSTSAAGDTSAAATTDETKANNVSDETKK